MEIFALSNFNNYGVEGCAVYIGLSGPCTRSRSKVLLVTQHKEETMVRILSWPRASDTSFHKK